MWKAGEPLKESQSNTRGLHHDRGRIGADITDSLEDRHGLRGLCHGFAEAPKSSHRKADLSSGRQDCWLPEQYGHIEGRSFADAIAGF